MKHFGKAQNLKKHSVGKHRVRIYGPGDIEGIPLFSFKHRHKVADRKSNFAFPHNLQATKVQMADFICLILPG